jgi:hypothetical protein
VPDGPVVAVVRGLDIFAVVLSFGVVNLRAAELAFGLSNRPREVDVPVITDVFHLYEYGITRVPVETLQPAVEF